MGQNVLGVMLGCKVKKSMKLTSDKPAGGALDAYDAIKTDHGPDLTEDGDVVGYFVAIHGDGSERDAETLSGEPISFAALAKSPAAKKARKKWSAFAAWMGKARGVAMPEPELYLTEVEIA